MVHGDGRRREEDHILWIAAKERLQERLVPLNLCYVHQTHENILGRYFKTFETVLDK